MLHVAKFEHATPKCVRCFAQQGVFTSAPNYSVPTMHTNTHAQKGGGVYSADIKSWAGQGIN
jgi:hypothetical protein